MTRRLHRKIGGRWSLRGACACAAGVVALAGGAPAARGQATATKGQAPPARLTAGQIAPAVLKKVKQATVHLKVALPNGQRAEGSGFFGVEPGVVLTNAHVLGMFKSDSRRPVKVEVVVNSGNRDETVLPAEVLGVDTNSDLAVLRVKGAKLPTPLEVGPADDLMETQSVYVFGFPFGSSLGKAITVNTSSVSSLRRNKDGVLQRVQLNGGMNPGNSGGPVVDLDGKVVGVAVAMIRQTQINFAVPGEAVHTMVAGKVHEVTMGPPYQSGKAARSRMELKLIDPLNKIAKVSLLVWGGKTAKNRADAPPPPPPGDPKRAEAKDFPVKQGVGAVDITLPAVADGETYWVQPSYTDGAGRAQKWLPIPWAVKTPVDRAPVVLALRHTPDTTNDLDLTSNTTFTLRDSEGEEHTLVSNLRVSIVETVGKVDALGVAAVHLKYAKVTVGAKLDNQPIPRDRQAQNMLRNLFQVGADLKVDTKGTIVDNRLDMSAVPRNSRAFVAAIATKIQRSIEATELTLPGKLTEANKVWTGRRDLPVDTLGDDELGVIDAKYWYIGRRKQKGVDEALVEIKGEVKGGSGNGLNLGGRVQGLAAIDLATGRVVRVNITTYLDLDLTIGGRPGKANGKLEVRLARKPAAPADAKAAPAAKTAAVGGGR